jgi:hypothetical protein
MDSVSFLKKIYLVVFISIVPVVILNAQSGEKTRRLETLCNNTAGVLPDIPEEIRRLRSGPVTQQVTLSDDGVLTISRGFYCKSFSGDNKDDTLVKATSVKKIPLSQLKGSKLCELNRHVNTIQLHDSERIWPLGFTSISDAEKAFSLLQSFIAEASPRTPSPSFSRSSLAAKAGYKYVVVSARSDEVSNGVRLLSMSEPSVRLLCWLTKKEPKEIEGLLAESMNRLPLFFFDLSVLDECSFFTQALPGATSYVPCSIGSDVRQSVLSDEKKEFEEFLKVSTYVGICFQSMPNLSMPTAICCRTNDERVIRKTGSFTKEQGSDVDWYFVQDFDTNNDTRHGTTYSWVTGISDNSYEALKHCLLQKELTPALFAYVLYPEFPSLKKLLTSKCCYCKDCSVEAVICRASAAFKKQEKKFSEFQRSVLKVALATFELGAPFGDVGEVGYNSWPLCLAIAEKIGLSEQEKTAVKALVEAPCEKGVKKKKEDSLFCSFAQDSLLAAQIGISLQDWLEIKLCFYEILFSLGKPFSQFQGAVKQVKSLQATYKTLLPFGIPRGLLMTRGPLRTRSVYSSYIWELRDPQHRDGLSLKRKREKYERMIVEGSKSGWKGHFWEWLKKEVQEDEFFSHVYLNDSQRKAYRAQFEGGVLVSPKLPQTNDDLIMMFIIDDWGTMYVGRKNEGDFPNEIGLNHASLSGGKPVASAGKLIFREGKLIGITDRSGHYRCGQNEMALALNVLDKMGVSTRNLEIIKDRG